MELKKYLLAGGLSTALLLGACNADSTEDTTSEDATDETTETEETTETNDTDSEDSASDDSASQDGEITYSGETGEYVITNVETYEIPAPEAEEGEEEEAEPAEPTPVVIFDLEFTNNSNVPTAPQEGFGLDLAVRQTDGTSDSTLQNLSLDIPEDHPDYDKFQAATELLEPGESAQVKLAYGPYDESLETMIQSRADENLDETLNLGSSSEETTDESTEDEE